MNKFDTVGTIFVFDGREEVEAFNCHAKSPYSYGTLEKGDILISVSKPHVCERHYVDTYCMNFIHSRYGLITLHGVSSSHTYGHWNRHLERSKGGI